MTAVPLSIFPSTDAVFRILDDEAVILDLASAAYFGLNSLGARFWQLVSQNSSYQAAVDVLLGEYAVDEVTLNQDLAALLIQLRDAGLVRVEYQTTTCSP